MMINSIRATNQNQNTNKQSFKASIYLKPFASGGIHEVTGIENCQPEILRFAGRNTLHIRRGLEVIFNADIYRPIHEFSRDLMQAITRAKTGVASTAEEAKEVVNF